MTHGLRATYVNQKCRCAECLEANAAYFRTRRTEGYVPRPAADHGSASKYKSGCRCSGCTRANAEEATERRRRLGIKPRNSAGQEVAA